MCSEFLVQLGQGMPQIFPHASASNPARRERDFPSETVLSQPDPAACKGTPMTSMTKNKHIVFGRFGVPVCVCPRASSRDLLCRLHRLQAEPRAHCSGPTEPHDLCH